MNFWYLRDLASDDSCPWHVSGAAAAGCGVCEGLKVTGGHWQHSKACSHNSIKKTLRRRVFYMMSQAAEDEVHLVWQRQQPLLKLNGINWWVVWGWTA